MVMRGAFADTLVEPGLRRIPMLFQHDPSEPAFGSSCAVAQL